MFGILKDMGFDSSTGNGRYCRHRKGCREGEPRCGTQRGSPSLSVVIPSVSIIERFSHDALKIPSDVLCHEVL